MASVLKKHSYQSILTSSFSNGHCHSSQGTSLPTEYYYDCNFHMEDVKSELGVDLASAKVLLRRFADVAPSGRITLDDFIELFHLHTSESNHVSRLFEFFEGEGGGETGGIQFKDFLCGVHLISTGASPRQVATLEQKAALCFVFSDKSGRGYVSAQDLAGVFDSAKKQGKVDEAPVVAKKVFDKFDEDKDGLWSFDEYLAFVSSSSGGASYLTPALELVKGYFGVCFESVIEKVAQRAAELEEEKAAKAKLLAEDEGEGSGLKVVNKKADNRV